MRRPAYVYIITCDHTDRVYVGKTAHPSRRMGWHCKAARDGVDSPLYRSMRKRGESAFHFHVISEHESDKEAFVAEKKLIADMRVSTVNLFNMNAGGEGASDPSPETREKLRAAATGKFWPEERKLRVSKILAGRSKPESQRQKLRARRGILHSNFGKKIHSEEQKTKWSRERKGRLTNDEHRKATGIGVSKHLELNPDVRVGSSNGNWKGDFAKPNTIKRREKEKLVNEKRKHTRRHNVIWRLVAASSETAPADFL